MSNQFNQKRKHDDNDNLNMSDVGPSQCVQKKIKKTEKLILEMKMDKKWVGSSQSLHESLTLLSQSLGNSNHDQIQSFLNNSLNQSDLMYVSQLTEHCTIINHEIDHKTSMVKIIMRPNKDFDFEKIYTTPSNIEIKSQGSTNYTESDTTFDQEMGTSCFQLTNFQVGQMNDEGL